MKLKDFVYYVKPNRIIEPRTSAWPQPDSWDLIRYIHGWLDSHSWTTPTGPPHLMIVMLWKCIRLVKMTREACLFALGHDLAWPHARPSRDTLELPNNPIFILTTVTTGEHKEPMIPIDCKLRDGNCTDVAVWRVALCISQWSDIGDFTTARIAYAAL